MNVAIGLGTACALLVCSVVASLFVSAYLGIPLELLVGWLFIAAMVVLIAALVIFLIEVFLATSAPHRGDVGGGSAASPEDRARLSRRAAVQELPSGGDQGSSRTSKTPPQTAGLHE